MARDLDYLFNTPRSSRLRNKTGSASGRAAKQQVNLDEKLRQGSSLLGAGHDTTAVSKAVQHAAHDVASPTMFLVL